MCVRLFLYQLGWDRKSTLRLLPTESAYVSRKPVNPARSLWSFARCIVERLTKVGNETLRLAVVIRDLL